MTQLEEFLDTTLDEFFQKLGLPQDIANQMVEHSEDVMVDELYKKLSDAIDTVFADASTASGVCALAMLNAATAVRLSQQIKIGTTEDMKDAEAVDPVFCIVALMMLSMRSLKATVPEGELH